MGFANLRELNDAFTNGQSVYTVWRKAPAQATVSGIWTDMSGMPGSPVPNYFASTPATADVLNGAIGIRHGGDVESLGKTKHLQKCLVMSNSATGLPVTLILCDYLLYYPFMDQGDMSVQTMDNTVTLPRYTNGSGVQVLAVLVAPQTGGQSFTFSYTNSAGVAGRTSPTIVCNTKTVNGTLVNTNTATAGSNGPFLPLQGNDTGVRSIQSVTFNTPDVGLITLVLVKPLATFMLRGVDAAVEVDFLMDRPSMPRIYDGAYLNFIALPTGSLSGVQLYGEMNFVWG